MNTILKSDVFFFITSVAVVILTILLVILIIYLIKISRDVKNIAAKAKVEANNIIDDVSSLRQNIKEQGGKFKSLAGLFTNFIKKKKK